MITDYVALGAVVAPLVIGLVQVAKQAGLPTRWTPVAAVLLGIAMTLVLGEAGTPPHPDYPTRVAAGVTAGLMAAGLYASVKTMRTPAG